MKKNENKGITLIALIITVIVLLILAGTTVSISINGGDIFGRATTAKEAWNEKVVEEENEVNNLLNILEEASTGIKIVNGNPSEWVVEGNTVVEYLGSATHLVIPNMIDNTKITAIGNGFSQEGQVSTANIKENMLNIQTLEISNGIETIGAGAFFSCTGLTGGLTIPNSVTTIGQAAFQGCTGLNGSLTISNNVTTIDSAAFLGCSGLTGNLIIPNSVTTIGQAVFSRVFRIYGRFDNSK